MITKNKILFFYISLITLFSACREGYSPKINIDNEGKFLNYISMDGKKFKDGESDFYPMIMNYSIHTRKLFENNTNGVYITPRAEYHPKYDGEFFKTLYPWGSDSAVTHSIIKSHFKTIKEMGFNTIRITGFAATDFFKDEVGFHSWSKINMSNSTEGNKNIVNGIIPLIKTVLSYAEESGLRVVLLISAIEDQPDNQLNLYSKLAQGLKNEKALMAYDIYNEPLYFDRGNYTKKQTKAFVESYSSTIKKEAPNHLTTIGLSHYKIVHEWDPELMAVDFLSFHIYPYGSKNLNNLERFDSKLYWINKNITKPWIIGETGLNTAENCVPLNLSCGNYSDQLFFMSYSLNKSRSAGSSGYSWWCFQDLKFPPKKIEGTCSVSDYGLLNRKDTFFLTSNGDTILGELKHNIKTLPFEKFVNDHPYKSKYWDDIAKPNDSIYYNIDYLPNHKKAVGKIINEKRAPVQGAIITLHNPASNSTYSTFTKPDGSFELKTGWTNIFTKLDFKLKVTAVKMETLEIPLKEIYEGEGNIFKDIVLKRFN
ncbi:MAG: cellulase family glycosylhydrolase [Vicingaceae bacterium]|nr:cellulase family glycosylhydrolase [Vicingaceae bacterium]